MSFWYSGTRPEAQTTTPRPVLSFCAAVVGRDFSDCSTVCGPGWGLIQTRVLAPLGSGRVEGGGGATHVAPCGVPSLAAEAQSLPLLIPQSSATSQPGYVSRPSHEIFVDVPGSPRGLCAVPSIGMRCHMYDRSEQGSQTASARKVHRRSLLPAPQLTYICDLRSQQPKPIAPAGAQSAIRTDEVSPLGRLERVVLVAE